MINDLHTFSEILSLHARKRPDKIWVYDLNTNEDYSFSRFNELVNKTVSFLIDKNCCYFLHSYHFYTCFIIYFT